jgi:putative transposase
VYWSVTNTIDANCCADVFLEANRLHEAPKTLNIDQGRQFNSEVFTEAVIEVAKSKLSSR